MSRKTVTILSVFLGISVIVAAAVVSYDNRGIKSLLSISKNKADNSDEKIQTSEKIQTETAAQASSSRQVPDPAVNIANKEIPVENNSIEFDLKVNIHENGKKQTYLAFEYYINGSNVLKEFDDRQVPEINGIFEKSSASADSTRGYRVKTVFLDRKYSKAYVVIEGAADESGVETAIYGYSLADLEIRKIFSGNGDFSNIGFTKDGSYMAFSLDYINPAGGAGLKNSSLYIIKCQNDEFLVSENKTGAGQPIGKQKVTVQPEYGFISWHANTVAKIRQVSGNSTGDGKKGDMLYDVVNDIFLNPDGTMPEKSTGTSGKPAGKESEAVKTLKNFYNYLSTAQYEKAYDILDSKFQLNAFKQFGTIELDKSDISISDFSAYGMFFQAGRIKSIVGEKISENTATIYYYQVVSLEQGDQEQAMAATLRKTDKGWKVSALNEGNVNEAPFKKKDSN